MTSLKQFGRLLRPAAVLLVAVFLAGCSTGILNPKGQIGHDQKTLLITAVVLMLLVVIPVIVMTLAFAWHYRASNTKARYEPNWSHSTAIEVVVWSIPCLIILVLAVLTWRSSHALDPYKPIDSDVPPVTIEAVSLDWKWLFIYPEQGIATVNEIAFPVDTPLNFRITSDTVMNAFFIPQLGTQIYSMAGMETKLHLIANEQGEFHGISSNYSGHGFAGMNFTARATTDEGFAQWVDKVKAEGKPLDQVAFKALAADRNEKRYPVTYYSSAQPGLFKSIIAAHVGDNHHFGMSHDPQEHAAMEHAGGQHADMQHAGMDHADNDHADHNADTHADAPAHGHAGPGEH
ncbi:ubiquinol oxidase subunit II [Stenotrophomonas sp. MMGLT7]|uniref:ubiquinol oxidase subunit II n=1 Tax=Stenotrophomonas sp. MMGLT7 TaxID=2901227 RepID=UPI001E39131A|nr:ubiquinol oxidase subunit II [Stenotrophomonas sp. MMGLT7]MCD7100127.1 ubiquinol oxidase subunit II [Stenotrophomonas sp. MMGLT7]